MLWWIFYKNVCLVIPSGLYHPFIFLNLILSIFSVSWLLSPSTLLSLCLTVTAYLSLYSIYQECVIFEILLPANLSESINYNCNLHNASRVAYRLFPFSLLTGNNIDIVMQKRFPKEETRFLHSFSFIYCWELQKYHIREVFQNTHPSEKQFKLETSFC